jgi:hypothetical protein
MTFLQVITVIKDSFERTSGVFQADTVIKNQKPLSVDTIRTFTNDLSNNQNNNSLIDSNILAAIIGALATLLCTIFWERIRAWIDAKKERRKKLIYFASLVKPIIVYSEKQSIDIKDFSQAIKSNPLEFPLLKYAPKSAIEKVVNKIEEEPFFNSFTTYYKPYATSVRSFKAITSIIEYQNLQLDQILEMVKSSQQYDHERKVKFKEHFGAANELAANSIADGSLQKHTKLLALLDKHLVEYLTHRPSPSDLKFAYENFVEPVKNGIIADSFYQIPVGLEIANNLQNATFIYHDILMQMDALQKDIAEIAENYKHSNEKLKSRANELLQDFFGD